MSEERVSSGTEVVDEQAGLSSRRVTRRRMLATVAVGTGVAWSAPSVVGLVAKASATSVCQEPPSDTQPCEMLRCAVDCEYDDDTGNKRTCVVGYQWLSNQWQPCEPNSDDYVCLGTTPESYDGLWQDCVGYLDGNGDQSTCTVNVQLSGSCYVRTGCVTYDSQSPQTPVTPTCWGAVGSDQSWINYQSRWL